MVTHVTINKTITCLYNEAESSHAFVLFSHPLQYLRIDRTLNQKHTTPMCVLILSAHKSKHYAHNLMTKQIEHSLKTDRNQSGWVNERIALHEITECVFLFRQALKKCRKRKCWCWCMANRNENTAFVFVVFVTALF